MKRSRTTGLTRLGSLAAAALCLWAISGCGDPVDRLLGDGAARSRLWSRVAGDPELSSQLVDHLLGADSTRTALLDRVMVSGGARQALLMRIATDRTMMEGAIHFAVQDTAMRDDLMTLFRGMEMGAAPAQGAH